MVINQSGWPTCSKGSVFFNSSCKRISHDERPWNTGLSYLLMYSLWLWWWWIRFSETEKETRSKSYSVINNSTDSWLAKKGQSKFSWTWMEFLDPLECRWILCVIKCLSVSNGFAASLLDNIFLIFKDKTKNAIFPLKIVLSVFNLALFVLHLAQLTFGWLQLRTKLI